MADPFSVAASALAVAGAGVKLAKTLHTCVESVQKSEKHFKPVADLVKLTASSLENIGSLLGEEDVRRLCKETMLITAGEALKGCERAFDDLRNFVHGLVKYDSDGKPKWSTWKKLTFSSLHARELELLLGNLERFKSSLDLVLGVLNLRVSMRNNNEDEDHIRALKLQVDRLLKVNHEAERVKQGERRLYDAVGTTTIFAAGRQPGQPSTERSRTPRSVARTPVETAAPSPLSVAPYMQAFALPTPRESAQATSGGSRNLPLGPDAGNNSFSGPASREAAAQEQRVQQAEDLPDEDELLQCLRRCYDTVVELSIQIDQAVSRWRNDRAYERQELESAYDLVRDAMYKLSVFETREETAATTRPGGSEVVVQLAGLDSIGPHPHIQQPGASRTPLRSDQESPPPSPPSSAKRWSKSKSKSATSKYRIVNEAANAESESDDDDDSGSSWRPTPYILEVQCPSAQGPPRISSSLDNDWMAFDGEEHAHDFPRVAYFQVPSEQIPQAPATPSRYADESSALGTSAAPASPSRFRKLVGSSRRASNNATTPSFAKVPSRTAVRGRDNVATFAAVNDLLWAWTYPPGSSESRARS